VIAVRIGGAGESISKNQYVTPMLWDAKDSLLKDNAHAKAFMEGTKLIRPPI